MSENMRIWAQVEKTDTRFTKKADVNGQKITSLNGTAMIMKATEVFGPVGLGFGWNIIEERFDPGAEMYSGEGDKRISLGHELNHTVKIKFWYTRDGQRGELEQYGCTRYLYKSKYGTTTDGEAPKKSLTDAIKKALSMLGFSADVFLGLFDDADYLEQRLAEEMLEQAEDREAEQERQRLEVREFVNSTIETMKGAQSKRELKQIHDHAVRHLLRRKEEKAAARISRELDRMSAGSQEIAA
jgi:hypothetical protein